MGKPSEKFEPLHLIVAAVPRLSVSWAPSRSRSNGAETAHKMRLVDPAPPQKRRRSGSVHPSRRLCDGRRYGLLYCGGADGRAVGGVEALGDACRPHVKVPPSDLRRTVEATICRCTTGANWRSIPAELGPWWRAAEISIR